MMKLSKSLAVISMMKLTNSLNSINMITSSKAVLRAKQAFLSKLSKPRTFHAAVAAPTQQSSAKGQASLSLKTLKTPNIPCSCSG